MKTYVRYKAPETVLTARCGKDQRLTTAEALIAAGAGECAVQPDGRTVHVCKVHFDKVDRPWKTLAEHLDLPHGWVATRFPNVVMFEKLHPTGGAPTATAHLPVPYDPMSPTEWREAAREAITAALTNG